MFQVSHRGLCWQGSNIFYSFLVQLIDFFKMHVKQPFDTHKYMYPDIHKFPNQSCFWYLLVLFQIMFHQEPHIS